MSMSQFATVEDYNAAQAVKSKPFVDIKDVLIERGSAPGRDVAWGIPVNHPRTELNGEIIHTSAIVSVSNVGDICTIETRNTIYNVLSWNVLGK